jgi:hypothetical protein
MILAAVGAATFLGTAVTQASATVAPAVFYPQETGYGTTLQSAEFAAREQLVSNYVCKLPYYLLADGQESDGTWWATMSAACSAYI